MANPPLKLDDVCKEVTAKSQEAASLCQQQNTAVKNAQNAYAALIKKKSGKMDPPKITVKNCASGSGGVIDSLWTKLWDSGGKFYKG